MSTSEVSQGPGAGGSARRDGTRAWESPRLRELGNLATVVRTGASKSATTREGAGGGGGEEPMPSMR